MMTARSPKIFLLVCIGLAWFMSPVLGNEKGVLNERYMSSLKLIGQGRLDDALTGLHDLIVTDPGFARAARKIVEVFKARNDLDGLPAFFDRLLKGKKNNAAAHCGLGLYFREKKEFARALESFRKAIGFSPRIPDLYPFLVNAFLDLKDPQAAEKLLLRVIRKNPANAAAHYGLGFYYFRQNKWDQAMRSLEKATSLDEGLIAAYRTQCDVYKMLERFEDVLKLASEKAPRCEGVDPDLQIDFYTRSSTACDELAKYQDSLEYDKKALALARQIGNKRSEGIILGNIGVYYAQTGQFEEALQYMKQKLEIARVFGDRKEESHTLMNIGSVLNWKGDFRSSLDWYKQALKVVDALDEPLNRALILGNIGVCHEHTSDFPRALDLYRQALAIFQDLKSRGNEAWMLGNIGSVISRLGNEREALEYFEKSLAILRETGNKNDEGWMLGTIGVTYDFLGDPERAFDYISNALEIARQIGDKRHEIMHLGNISGVYQKKGMSERAMETLDQALTVARQIGDVQGIADVSLLMGGLHIELGKYDKAREDHLRALMDGKRMDNLEIIWNAEWGLAQAAEKTERNSDALEHYQRAIDAIESVRGKLATEEQKVGYMRGKVKVYEGYIELLYKLWKRNPSPSLAGRAFEIAERAKARAFLDLLAEAKIEAADGLSQDLHSREKDLQEQLASIQQKLLNPEIKEPDRERLLSQLEESESLYHRFIADIRDKNPKYASLVYPEPYSLARVQKGLLDGKTFLVEFFVGEENTFIWAISRNDVLYFGSTPSASGLPGKLSSYLGQISQDWTRIDARLGKVLYDGLLKRALVKIPVSSHLVIIPDGSLLRFPFEVLVKKVEGHSPRYLIEDYTISYGPSASALGEIQALRKDGKPRAIDFLAMGNSLVQDGNPEEPLVAALELSGTRLSPLPYVEEEVLALGRVYQAKKRRTEIFLKANASEEVIKSGKTAVCGVLHLATHGLINDRVPALSGLVLSPSAQPDGEDGFLRLNEIFNLDLNADLVSLSACETGLGKDVKGEGVIGLSRAFFYAGSRQILASLWMVSDQSTAELMKLFYGYCLEGKRPEASLRLAKLRLLKGPDDGQRHPFFWAPFILLGTGTSAPDRR